MKIIKGDKVKIELIVEETDIDRFRPRGFQQYFSNSMITDISYRKPEIDDIVVCEGSNHKYQVLAIDGTYLFCKMTAGNQTRHILRSDRVGFKIVERKE